MSQHNQRYGYMHRRLRAHYKLLLAQGQTFTCGKCNLPVTAKSVWHLGHVEGGGPRDYSGPQHASCNVATNVAQSVAEVGACGPPIRRMTGAPHDPDFEPGLLWCGDQLCDCGRYQ